MRRSRRSKFPKWGIIGGAIATGAALIPLVPMIKKRAMRVTTILKKDHRMLSGLIMTLQVAPRTNARIRRALFDQIRNIVMVHAQTEEEILYPALRNLMFNGGEFKVEEAYREHQHIKDLLNDLSAMDVSSDAFDRRLADLKHRIDHHIDEEEGAMFKALTARFPTDRLEELGRRIHDRKADLKGRVAA